MVANAVEVLEEMDWEEEELKAELTGGYESDDDENYYRTSPIAETSTSLGYIESCIGLEFDEATESKEYIMI